MTRDIYTCNPFAGLVMLLEVVYLLPYSLNRNIPLRSTDNIAAGMGKAVAPKLCRDIAGFYYLVVTSIANLF